MPREELQRLQRGIAAVAPSMVYAHESRASRSSAHSVSDGGGGALGNSPAVGSSAARGGTWASDALDLLVEQMRGLRSPPSAAERVSYQSQLEEREAMIRAQRTYESVRVSARRQG